MARSGFSVSHSLLYSEDCFLLEVQNIDPTELILWFNDKKGSQ